MPTYEYECRKCRRVFEIRQRISEPALTVCDLCGGEVRRLLSPAPFILKGRGWYVTDYPSEARKKARESEKNVESEKKPAPSAEQSSTSTSGATPTTSPSTTSPSSAAASSTAASSTASSD